MSFCQIHWFSQTLQKQVGTFVLLPDSGKPPFATYYLLHGLSDDHTIWQRRTRIEMYAASLPLIVVMPDGFRGFYTDNAEGPAYGRYIGEELPAFVERNFPAKADRSARCIGGLSMGGYGALRTALGYADRFASANSHSGALDVGQIVAAQADDSSWRSEMTRIFGPSPLGTSHDLVHLAKKAKAARRLPKLRIDCGREDFLIEHNRRFHQELTKLKIEHEYEEFAGEHTWDYWDVHVREAIAFHAKNLGLKGNGR